MDLTVHAPWWFAFGPYTGEPYSINNTMVVGDRGLIIREFSAQFGGQRVSQPSISVLCNKLELVPSRGMKTFLAGDFVDMKLEFLVLPREMDFEGVP